MYNLISRKLTDLCNNHHNPVLTFSPSQTSPFCSLSYSPLSAPALWFIFSHSQMCLFSDIPHNGMKQYMAFMSDFFLFICLQDSLVLQRVSVLHSFLFLNSISLHWSITFTFFIHWVDRYLHGSFSRRYLSGGDNSLLFLACWDFLL